MLKIQSIRVDGRFRKQAKGVFEKYNFDVGVLDDGSHKLPARRKSLNVEGTSHHTQDLVRKYNATNNLKALAGGPARKTSRRDSGLSISQVSEKLRANTGINFYTRPFKSGKNREVIRVIQNLVNFCLGKSEAKRVENALQAVVRNPIVRGDYGRNSAVTAKIKGFNRFMIDTGQLFKAIRAKVSLRRV